MTDEPTRCQFCPGLAALAVDPACERVILHGDRMAGGFTWRVDVVTPERAGHRMGLDLAWAVNGAVREAMGRGDEAEET